MACVRRGACLVYIVAFGCCTFFLLSLCGNRSFLCLKFPWHDDASVSSLLMYTRYLIAPTITKWIAVPCVRWDLGARGYILLSRYLRQIPHAAFRKLMFEYFELFLGRLGEINVFLSTREMPVCYKSIREPSSFQRRMAADRLCFSNSLRTSMPMCSFCL